MLHGTISTALPNCTEELKEACTNFTLDDPRVLAEGTPSGAWSAWKCILNEFGNGCLKQMPSDGTIASMYGLTPCNQNDRSTRRRFDSGAASCHPVTGVVRISAECADLLYVLRGAWIRAVCVSCSLMSSSNSNSVGMTIPSLRVRFCDVTIPVKLECTPNSCLCLCRMLAESGSLDKDPRKHRCVANHRASCTQAWRLLWRDSTAAPQRRHV